VTQGTLDSNYSYTFVPGTLTVTPAALIVTADNKSRPYNTENPALTYVVTDSGGAVVSVSGTAALSTTAVKSSPVGSYPISVAQGTLDSNYSYTFVPGTLTVTPATLIVTADNKSRLYNTANPALTYVVKDSSGAVVSVSGTAALSTTAIISSPVGDYPITPTQGTLDSNYTYTFIDGTLTVTRPALVVTADDKSRLYNTDNPALTYVVTDGSGAVVSVSGTAALSTTAVKTSPVGDYPITPTQGTLDSNYSYTFVNGKLTVTQPALTVTADDKSRTYNTDNPALTYVVTDSSGTVVTVPGTAALSTTAVKSSPVGSYPITVTQGSLDKNYTYTFIPGTLTVTKSALVVTADNKSRPYNTENPTLTYVVKDSSGNVVNVSGTASLSTSAVKSSPVGDYPITPTQGTLDNNYSYTYVNGTLTITRPALTVIADNQTRPYNTPNPALTYVVKDSSGNVVSVSGTASLSTTAIISSPVGDYPITPTQGTLDNNYTYTYRDGTLTITRSALRVVADDKSRPYNTDNPALTYVVTDSSGTVVSVSGAADLSTTAVKSSNAGGYPITVKQGTLDNNYTYTYVNATLTVTPIGVAVALPGSERYYGERNADAVSDLTSTNVTWNRNDLVFYYGGAWVPFSTFADAFSGNPEFKTDAKDYTAKVGDYNVVVYTAQQIGVALRELPEPLLEEPAHRLHILCQRFFLDHFEHFQGDGTSQRASAIGGRVAARPKYIGIGRAHPESAKRKTGADSLGHTDRIGQELFRARHIFQYLLEAAIAAGAVVSTLDLIHHEEQVMFIAKLAQAEQVLRAGRLNASLTLHPFDQDCSRPGANRRFHGSQVIKRNVVIEALYQRVKAGLHFLLPRGGDAGQGPAMKRIQSGDDFIAARIVTKAARQFVEPFIGLGAAIGEEAFARSDAAGYLLGQEPLPLVIVKIGGMDHPLGLSAQGLHDERVSMAQRAHGNAGSQVQIAPAIRIPDIAPLAVAQDQIEAAIARDDILIKRLFDLFGFVIHLSSPSVNSKPPARFPRLHG
jgi:hypothetical protein